MTNSLTLVDKAAAFTQAAHNSINHRRKYTNEPYWVHPERVAAIVAEVCGDAEVIAAAWMHDIIEDVAPHNPDFSQGVILDTFGERVTQLVLEVTDVSRPEHGNRAARKAIDRAHLANATFAGKLIKLADMIDNLIDINQHDPHFAKVFRKEILLSIDSLRPGSEQLYQRLRLLLTS